MELGFSTLRLTHASLNLKIRMNQVCLSFLVKLRLIWILFSKLKASFFFTFKCILLTSCLFIKISCYIFFSFEID